MPDLLLELRSEEIPAAQSRNRSAEGARTRKQENGMRVEKL
jgi:glycyl-tRNA synthetase beta subunit